MKVLERLNVFKTISSPQRISSIDIFRSIAIISVVLFHFNNALPLGYLGVDLFFVISGFLIGGILTKDYKNGSPINFFKFFLQRGFKVWPSYYAFFFVGFFLVRLLYTTIEPGEIVTLDGVGRYLFFYQNFTGPPYHWSFDHAWSLCIEEHFYILLPILFIVAQRSNKKYVLFVMVFSLVLTGISSKVLMLLYSNSKDTYSATNNRIDALAWGVLLNFVMVYMENAIKPGKRSNFIAITGIAFLTIAIYIECITSSVFYQKVIFHSFTPLCFALIIGGFYHHDFSRLKFLRFIAYYSYNWYLWHPIYVKFITFHLGNTLLGFSAYIVCSFLSAMLFTILVEEKFLAKRSLIINRLFKSKDVVSLIPHK